MKPQQCETEAWTITVWHTLNLSLAGCSYLSASCKEKEHMITAITVNYSYLQDFVIGSLCYKTSVCISSSLHRTPGALIHAPWDCQKRKRGCFFWQIFFQSISDKQTMSHGFRPTFYKWQLIVSVPGKDIKYRWMVCQLEKDLLASAGLHFEMLIQTMCSICTLYTILTLNHIYEKVEDWMWNPFYFQYTVAPS